MPPLANTVCPLTQPPSPLHSAAITPAMSSGSPSRLCGVRCAKPAIICGVLPSVKSVVLTTPGASALTEIIRQQYAEETAAKGLRAEWVQVTVSAGGDPEAAKFDALYAGLKADRFDLAMSGQADISTDQSSSAQAREVDWTAPTALLHTNILYSGRDGYDLSGLVGSTRSRFIDAVKGWREVIVMCMVNPGPSPTNSAALVAAINAVGGNARLEETTSLAALQDAIAKQTIHFSVGDAVASSWIGSQLGFKGLNLDIAAGTQPLQTAQHVAAFTLPV